jgi:methyl-accepting chemotaxis protein
MLRNRDLAGGAEDRTVPIARQVLLGYAAPLGAVLLLVLVATAELGAVAKSKDRVIERDARLVIDAHRLNAAVADVSSTNRAFFLTRSEADLDRWNERKANVDQVIVDLEAGVHTDSGRRLISKVQAERRAWEEGVQSVVDAARNGASSDRVASLAGERAFPRAERLRGTVQDLIDQENRLITAAVKASNDDVRSARVIIWTLAGVALGLALGISTWITRRVSRRLEGLARRVDAAASEVLAGTTQQVTGFTEQAAAVQQTVATVEELVQTAEQSADRAQAVAERSQQSAVVAQEGIRAVDQSGAGIQAIREQVDSIAQCVVVLAEKAQAISDIIATVNEIADQTHLLALNAAIEAARAGEHGRGFAVVASEVKSLADQSRRATGQVRDILGEIQQGTNAAVMVTEAGTKSVNDGLELVSRTGDTINQLADNVASATTAAEQIAVSSTQQAGATAQISHAMKDVDTAMEQNLASARQAEEAARGLDEIARRMKAMVGVE